MGSRKILRAMENATYLRSIGAPCGVRGLFLTLVILSQGLRALLPFKSLLHPAVIATVVNAVPQFSGLVITAGLKVCRTAARRVNAAFGDS